MQKVQAIFERLWYEARSGKGYATERELADLVAMSSSAFARLMRELRRAGDVDVDEYGCVRLDATPFTNGERTPGEPVRRQAMLDLMTPERLAQWRADVDVIGRLIDASTPEEIARVLLEGVV